MTLELKNDQISRKPENEMLLKMLDRGIDDMEAGRELPLAEAFGKITELRDKRRNAETQSHSNVGSYL